jgi:hypothetical protein
MPFLELFDETLDINSTENYELAVQASPFDLSFCILDTLRNKFVLLRSYEPEENNLYDADKLRDIISRDDFLTRHFKKTNLITPSPQSTLVPAALYDDSKRDEYFTFNQTYREGNSIQCNRLSDPDIFIVFSLPNPVVEMLKVTFPGEIFLHQLKPLFRYINLNRRSVSSNDIYIHFEKGYFNMVIFDQNSLKLCNTFYYQFISDIQYFVLYVLKRMNIRQDEPVYISGKILKSNEILTNFSKYLSMIKFAEPTGNPTFSYVFHDTDLHRYLNLFNSVICE